jgi:DNA end-binding protein Ku
MVSRALWKGQIRLSLVSIPVEIHSATKTGARVAFRQIHGPSGKRVRYEKTVPGIGAVKADDILKGYEIGDDEYLLLEKDEVDAIKLETKKTLELVQFVGLSEIPPLYYDRPITWFRRTTWPRTPTVWCATRYARPTRSGLAS